MAAKKKTTRKRYTPEEKQEVLDFVAQFNVENGRGGNKAASEKFGISPITISQWSKKAKGGEDSTKEETITDSGTNDEQLIKVLAGKGFKFTRLVNSLTGEVVEEKSDPKFKEVNFVYRDIPTSRAEHDCIYVIQTSPQIQVAMTLEKFLKVAGIKP